MDKQSTTLTFLILGSFIGAGFCSGKEIVSYFAIYGYYSLFFTVLCGILLCLFMRIFLRTGKFVDGKGTCCFGNKFFNVITTIASVIIVSSMLAGSVSVGKSVSSVVGYIVYAISIAVTFIVCVGGIKRMDKANKVLVPVILMVIVVTCVLSITVRSEYCSPSYQPRALYMLGGLGACLNYISLNILLMGMLLMRLGKYYTDKQIRVATTVSSIAITIFLGLISITLLSSNLAVFTADMPMLALAYNIHPVLGAVCSVVVWAGLITTLISSTYATMDNMPICRQNTKLCIATILSVSSIVSLLGFSNIVTYLYLVIGVMGVVYTYCVLRYYYSNVSAYKKE